jgi:hypothetical protein
MVADWAERNLKLVAIILFVATTGIFAGGLTAAARLQEPPPTEAERIFDHGTLLVVMQDGCGPCTYFSENIGPKYRRTAQGRDAPLRYIDIRDVRSSKTYRLTKGVFATPTLLMIDGFGREVGRHIGSPTTVEDLAAMVDGYAAKMKRKGV